MLKYNQTKEFLSDQRELFINSLVILICLILFLKLPATDSFQKICKETFFFLLVPIFYIRLILKKNLQEFGFSLPQKKSDFFWAIGIFLFSLIIFILLIKFSDLRTNYYISKLVRNNFGAFLFYEFIAFNFLFLLQEIFFKGFVLFSFSSKFKSWSILITALLYCVALFAENSFIWQAAPLIFFSFFGTLLAYKGKSLWLAYAVSLISIISLDSILIFISK